MRFVPCAVGLVAHRANIVVRIARENSGHTCRNLYLFDADPHRRNGLLVQLLQGIFNEFSAPTGLIRSLVCSNDKDFDALGSDQVSLTRTWDSAGLHGRFNFCAHDGD